MGSRAESFLFQKEVYQQVLASSSGTLALAQRPHLFDGQVP